MAETEFRKGPASPEQLPQGSASQVNAANAEQVQAEQLTVTPTPEMAPRGFDGTEGFRPGDEDDEILYGDPASPQPITLGPDRRQMRVPTQVIRHLPMIRAMLDDPSAPEALRGVYRALVDRLEQEMKAK